MLLLNIVKDYRPTPNFGPVFRKSSIYSIISLVFMGLMLVLIKMLKPLYPPSFFELTWNRKVLERMKCKREIIGVAVVLSFIVNIISGLALTLIHF